MPIRLALIDDHKIVRDGLKALLADIDGMQVVAEGSNGHDAIAMAEDPGIDVFLMDIAMPGVDGLDATRRIIEKKPGARIIVLSMHATADYISSAISRGARGYMVKNMSADELERAIRKVFSGGDYITPSLQQTTGASQAPASTDDVEQLTARQREILLALVDGLTTTQIADRLRISNKTVEAHRSQLMKRLAIHDVPGLVRFAIRHRLVSAE